MVSKSKKKKSTLIESTNFLRYFLDKKDAYLRRLSPVERSEIKWGYLLIAPQMIGLAIFTLGPILFAAYLSFTRWNMISPPQWVGIR